MDPTSDPPCGSHLRSSLWIPPQILPVSPTSDPPCESHLRSSLWIPPQILPVDPTSDPPCGSHLRASLWIPPQIFPGSRLGPCVDHERGIDLLGDARGSHLAGFGDLSNGMGSNGTEPGIAQDRLRPVGTPFGGIHSGRLEGGGVEAGEIRKSRGNGVWSRADARARARAGPFPQAQRQRRSGYSKGCVRRCTSAAVLTPLYAPLLPRASTPPLYYTPVPLRRRMGVAAHRCLPLSPTLSLPSPYPLPTALTP